MIYEEIIFESSYEFDKIQRDLTFLPVILRNDIMTESGEDVEGFFDKIIAKIRGIVKTVKDKIMQFLGQEKVQSRINEVEEIAKDDPSIMKMKVKQRDYARLQKLNEEASNDISKPDCDVERRMEKYRSQRNKILIAGGIITVTLSAALYFITKNKNETINKLDQAQKESERKLNVLKGRYSNLKKNYAEKVNENNDLRDKLEVAQAKTVVRKVKVVKKQVQRDVSNTTSNVASEINQVKKQAAAQTEILKNAVSDVAQQTSESFSVISNGEKSVLSKIKAVKKVTTTVVKSASDVVSGEGYNRVATDRMTDLKDKRKKKEELIDKAKKVLNNPNATQERKQKAKEYISKANRDIEEMRKEYAILKARMKK